MNKIYSFIIFLSAVLFVQAQTLSVDGTNFTIDTLENHLVGPGTQYVSLRLTAPSKRMDVFFLKADIKNPHIQIRTALGRDSIYTGEAPTVLAKRISTEGNFYFAGTNGDFYSTTGNYIAYPGSGNMVNGEIAKIPGSRNVFTIDDLKIPNIGVTSYNGNIKFGSSTWTINSINHLRETNQLILFNQNNGKYTHTNTYGTEVLVELLEGNTWGSNKTLKAKVLKIEKEIGNMAIPKGKAVLSGNGTAATALNQLSVNDEIDVRLNLIVNNNSASNFLQMSGGDNYKTMLQNGVVEQTSVWAERHPRTGLGYSQNKDSMIFCVVDGRGVSIGATTKELAIIMKSGGAYTAFNMDGGGSSSMFISEYDGPVNKNSDGNERATANSVFIVSTAPTDNTVGIIKPYKSNISLPEYGEHIPMFYGYNQYGILLTPDLKGVVLSCPASLGTIIGNKFIATGNTAGNITATYNGTVTTTIPVNFIPVSEIKIRLDSVILDNRRDYLIEVVAKTEAGESLISSAALSWNVTNTDICQIEGGVVKALKNGKTTVTGQINDAIDEIQINVEIPAASTIIGDSLKIIRWTLNASSFLNAQLNQENLPKSWEHGAGINFVHAAGRSPFIKLTNQSAFYGLPDTIKFVLNIGDMVITRAIFSLRSNEATNTTSIEFNSFEQNKDFTLDIPVNQLFNASDRAIYPIWFDNVNFFLGASEMTVGKAYTMAVKDILLVYKDYVVSGIASITTNYFRIYPNPTTNQTIYLQLKENISQKLRTEIYNLSGQLLATIQHGIYQGGIVPISLKNLKSGIYLLKVYENERVNATKFKIE
ncbi:MAG: T9SS type A sorting domain-containing protein [Paludibacter sp.]|nr:T9SS type A sorting domain-containing protein [Paludibacter sp.]